MPTTTLMRAAARVSSRLAPAMAAFCACATLLSAPTTAREIWEIETAAPYALVIDMQTGDVLFEKDADTPFPPASMSKLMTAAMTFDRLAGGRLKLEDTFPVSEAAFRKEGSTMCLNLGDEPTVADLLRGLIVMSGNDAAIVIAEGLAGSEGLFAEQMTARAGDLGMTNSTFANATGLPDANHRMTARDLAALAIYILGNHEDFFPIYSETEFGWATCVQKNRNPLLYLGEEFGGDGLKTGFTEESGYGIVATAERDGRRIVAVLSGLESIKARSQEARRMIEWAFRDFRHVTLVEAGDVVGQAEVWIGAADMVDLVAAEDVMTALPDVRAEDVSFKIRYEGPLEAPLEKGVPAGELVVSIKGLPEKRVPLITAAAVEEGGFMTRLGAIFHAADEQRGLQRRRRGDERRELEQPPIGVKRGSGNVRGQIQGWAEKTAQGLRPAPRSAKR